MVGLSSKVLVKEIIKWHFPKLNVCLKITTVECKTTSLVLVPNAKARAKV